jgi:uncharacterized membrane protein YdjX (TVP38/TMEM64 family)
LLAFQSLVAMRRFVRPALVLVLVAGIVWASRSFELGRYLTRDGMHALLEPAGRYGPLVFMVICIVGMFHALPGVVLVALGGVALGAPTAFVCGWLACLIGATSTFLVVRYLAGDYFHSAGSPAHFPPSSARSTSVSRHGFRTVLVLGCSSSWRRRSAGRSARPASGWRTTSPGPPSA